MDAEKLFMAINDIDNRLIEGANTAMKQNNDNKIKVVKNKSWVKWTAMAAGLVVCLGLGAATLAMTGMIGFNSYESYDYATAESAPQYAMEAPEMEMMMADEAVYDTDTAGSSTKNMVDSGSVTTTSNTSSPSQHGLKIVYRYDANIETRDFDVSIELIEQLCEKYGGYIENSDLSAGKYYDFENPETERQNPRYAYYNFRVPVENYNAFIDELSSSQNITRSSEYADDITSYYVDTEARLAALMEQEQRILVLAQQAENISDLLVAEQQLSEVRYQIENYERQKQSMDDQVNFTYISVGIDEVSQPSISAGDSFFVVMGDAVRGSLVGVVDFFKNAVVVVIYAIPYMVLAFIAFVIIKKIVKNKRAKKNKQD